MFRDVCLYLAMLFLLKKNRNIQRYVFNPPCVLFYGQVTYSESVT